RRLKVRPATETGNPASRAAIRATFRLSSPAWFAQPRYTSSTKAGSTPARLTTSPTTSAARSSGRTSLSAPWCRPIGVRTAPTITASVILEFPESPHRTGGFGLRGHDAHSRHFRTPPPETEKSPRGIPLLRGMRVEIGCGARVRDFDGRRYFYFWHYERTNRRSESKEDYIGRVDSESVRSDLLRRMAVYHRKAEQEFTRRRARIEGLIEAAHTSTWRYVFLSASLVRFPSPSWWVMFIPLRRRRTDLPVHPPPEGGIRPDVPHPPVHHVHGCRQDPCPRRGGPRRDPIPRPAGPLVPRGGQRIRGRLTPRAVPRPDGRDRG